MMQKRTKEKVIVLLSGGIDSSTLAYLVSKKYKNKKKVFTLSIDYGQRHKIELKSAYKIFKRIHGASHKVVKTNLTSWGNSSLTDKNIKVPVNREIYSTRKRTKDIPNTYVPARNTIFLSYALSFAEAINANEIYIGVNHIDYSGYVDCRPKFIKKFQELAKLATVKGVSGGKIKIKTPLINKTKAEIIKLGSKLGVDWSSTWSCYLGKKPACGICDSCQLRLKGFVEAKVKDPLKYKKLPEFYNEWLKLVK